MTARQVVGGFFVLFLCAGGAYAQCPNSISTTSPRYKITEDGDPDLIPNPPTGQWFRVKYTPKSSQRIRLVLFREGSQVSVVLPNEDIFIQWPGGRLEYTFENCVNGSWVYRKEIYTAQKPQVNNNHVSFTLRPADSFVESEFSFISLDWGADVQPPYLRLGEYLRSGDYMASADGQYFSTMRSDGNLVVSRGPDPAHDQGSVWESAKVGKYALSNESYFAVVQGDGNFVIYRGPDPSQNQGFVWGSVQDGHYVPSSGNYFVVMQGDGNLVVYRGPDPSQNQGFVWGSIQSLAQYNQQNNPQPKGRICYQNNGPGLCGPFDPPQPIGTPCSCSGWSGHWGQ